MLGDTATRTLLAVMRQGRPTVRSVAAETGICVSWTHATLRKLRTAGLVEWDDEKQATLRAMVASVRTPVRYDVGNNETAPSQRVEALNPGPCRPVGGRLP